MVRYSREKPLRVFTAFSGYDSLLYPDTEPTTGDQLKLF